MAEKFSADTLPASVVVPGGAKLVQNQYIGDASTTFAAGDLVRINTSGQVKLAGTTTDTTGPVHGMVLSAYVAPAATVFIPVLKFTAKTVLGMSIYVSVGENAEQQDLTVGATYTLRRSAAGIYTVTATTTKGIAVCVGKSGNVKWFDPDYALDADYSFVYVRFTQANIDAVGG